MSFGTTEIIILLVVILIVFGAGKLPKVMGDLGRGMKSFKESMNEETSGKKEAAETVEKTESEEKK